MRFATHEAFGQASVAELLGPRYDQARTVEAVALDSGVFLNRGARFEFVPFPPEAQLTPAFSVNVADFDGDGREDVFLSQNFFGSGSDLCRDDAGRGLWLRGNGRGGFVAGDTGIRVEGEQRAAALADFDHDGRVDVAVSQNNGATRLYANRRAKRGLRVALVGSPANPEAVGATMRLRYADGRVGPCRANQTGSGYWAQDSAVQILGMAEPAVGLWIRWPGGKEETVALQAGQWEVEVKFGTGAK
jgi:hypothetical protein